ncbi:MAG TPA: glycosyltransferase [Sphingomonas sp.]|nr:glycosyltransferase [Sphingomonas sp.]
MTLARFAIALLFGVTWTLFSIWVSQPWLGDLGALTHPLLALFALTFVAYIPGFMNAFLLASLLLEPRPRPHRRTVYPGITVLIAAYEEEAVIATTLESLRAVNYPGLVEAIVIDDGSRDATAALVEASIAAFAGGPSATVRLLSFEQNRGKAQVLNSGLAEARHDLIVTIDADTRLQPGSLTAIVERMLGDPRAPVAVAGSVLVGNPDQSLIAGAQQWDYFHGIAAVKRMQSMYGGTLVAQGAFSIYRRDVLVEAGGWPDTVGEDIVLTWALLKRGYAVGYAEDAIAWTQVPADVASLARQRKRWARGMIEALEHHRAMLFQPRLTTMFIWWNLLFISLDLAFTLIFVPGLVLALFGVFWLAGPITLLVLPLAALWNVVIYRIQSRMLKRAGVTMRRNWRGFALYVGVYPLLMQPISVWGYAAEMSGRRKEWGTA